MSRKGLDPFGVEKGEKKFGYINIVDTVAAKFNMPVGVVNGISEGPTLAVTGGLYPTEYCGVEAASRLYQLVNPDELSGRFITIPCINMSSLQFRTPLFKLISSSTTPIDGMRINNSFPGTQEGRPSQVLAYKVFKILSKASYHVDFRGGDLNESHLVHTIYLRSGKETDEICEAMAKVFGLEYVLPGTPEISHTSPGTMIYELCNAGIASIISESGLGYREQPEERFIYNHIQGTINIMKHFGMLKGEPTRPKDQQFLDMVWKRVTAPVSGLFTAVADFGDILKEGEVIGRITDLDGSVLSEIASSIDGVVHTMFPRKIVHIGDPLYYLLEIKETTDR